MLSKSSRSHWKLNRWYLAQHFQQMGLPEGRVGSPLGVGSGVGWRRSTEPLSWSGWAGAAELAALFLLILTLSPTPLPGLSPQVRLRLGPWIRGVREGGGGSEGPVSLEAVLGSGLEAPTPVLPSWPGPVGVRTTQLSCVP